jgi:eukaryotic-like serine/threonine-protein kinase
VTELAPGYEIVEVLERGATLDVYDVFSRERLCRCVAKVVRPDAAGSAARRVEREGRLLKRLAHPHLVRAYEVLPGPIVILETLDGATLSHIIRVQRRRLGVSDLAHLGSQLCSAAHYLHGQGWLHLDLKPSNVISDYGHAKVIDLSLARRPGRVPRGIGTVQYLSPEQARGDICGPPADVWGIGATLWTAAAGERPFPDHDQLTRRADPIGRRRRLPRALAAAIDACLEADAAARPSVLELDDALGGVL